MSTPQRDPEKSAPSPEKSVLRTLFSTPLRPGAGAPARRRAAPRAEPTSDTTRFRGLLVASAVGALVAVLFALFASPAGSLASPVALSRPHANAKLSCADCHGTVDGAAAPPSACAKCHGEHGSVRAGHRRAAQKGSLTCATCHPIHSGDQGVFFDVGASPVRFGPGFSEELPESAFRPAAPTTVPIVAVGSCRGCHVPESPSDPLARCLSAELAGLGDAAPVLCFDEHRATLPDPGAPRSQSSVCGAQHGDDRAAAWEAARVVAVRYPVLGAAATSAAPTHWVGAALVAAALAYAGSRGARAWAARRRRHSVAADAVRPTVRARLPVVDATRCLGCSACVDVCPYDVLAVERYVAIVARPDACCGLTLCEQVCPNGSLRVLEGDVLGDRPALSDALEAQDVPGLFLAGDITGLSLIKNAILQGRVAMDHAAAFLAKKRSSQGAVLDVLVVGAGPAGLSAALRAKELGLRFAVLEQASAAHAIRSFPRGKLVFDQPLDLPLVGPLWLRESTKEELLTHWERLLRREVLPIFEGERLVSLERRSDGTFALATTGAEGDERARGRSEPRLARAVILAIGRRGTPRRLDAEVPPEHEARVFYALADAASFAGQRVVVVGLGDVAMEAAVALSRQPATSVTVLARADGFRRGSARNIEELSRAAADGRIDLRFEREVKRVAADLVVAGPAGEERVPFDALFVLTGSIPAWDLLRSAGVRPRAEGAVTSA
jgi:thioredoxin reductase/NAD-dependent dihydropyrimidine dehydrogenase PreA subunit